jgi:biotin carboxyl carrier protein
VHSILFREGAQVPAHESLIIVESLRTLVPHALPMDARVAKWNVAAEDSVHAGQELAEIETR